jgi:tRNA pseudouridine32 synthase/23S rRNA pseudouridine746 synthase
MTPEITFQNAHFVIVDKPPETLSVPSRFGQKDPRPVIGTILQSSLKVRIFPVHRLDEDVSGLLLFAFNAEAHRTANRWFEGHAVIKTYEALSKEIPLDLSNPYRTPQTWTCKLMRGKKRAYEADFGKESLTRALLVGQNHSGRSVWHLQPLTGRSHQLRYEMAKHGFPIDRDNLYGSDRPAESGQGIALRAFRLDFSRCDGRERFNLPAEIQIPTNIPWDNF